MIFKSISGEIYLSLAIFFTAISQVLYKSFFKTRSWPALAIAISLFTLTPLMAYMSLRTLPLSTVYMATGLTYVLVLILARLLLGEAISRYKMQATLMIIGRLVIFNL